MALIPAIVAFVGVLVLVDLAALASGAESRPLAADDHGTSQQV